MPQPFVSVVIPCRDEGASLARCLDSVLASDYPSNRMEVLIADGMSGAATRGIIALYAARDNRVRLIDNPERITPAGLNHAISAAKGSFIQRVDAHSTISPNYISLAVQCLESRSGAVSGAASGALSGALSGAWTVGGPMQTVAEQGGRFATAIQKALGHRFGVGNSHFRTAANRLGPASTEPQPVDAVFNACWRREVFDKIGGFNEQLRRSQDIDFSSRIRAAGGVLLLHPEMRTRYFSKANLSPFLKQCWNNGVWALLPIAYLRRLPVSLRHLVPLAFVTSLIAATLIAFTGFIPAIPVWTPVLIAGPYLAANLFVSAKLAWPSRSLTLLWQLPLIFASLHFGYGIASLWGAAKAVTILMTAERTPEAQQPKALSAAAAHAASPEHGTGTGD